MDVEIVVGEEQVQPQPVGHAGIDDDVLEDVLEEDVVVDGGEGEVVDEVLDQISRQEVCRMWPHVKQGLLRPSMGWWQRAQIEGAE